MRRREVTPETDERLLGATEKVLKAYDSRAPPLTQPEARPLGLSSRDGRSHSEVRVEGFMSKHFFQPLYAALLLS